MMRHRPGDTALRQANDHMAWKRRRREWKRRLTIAKRRFERRAS